jgi:hypothetical protein
MKINIKLVNRIIKLLIVTAVLVLGGLLVYGARMFMGGN